MDLNYKKATFGLQKSYMAKTTPTSIRFEEDQFIFVCEREKLNSPQKVVNFLLQDYWIKNKLVPQINQVQNQLAAIEVKRISDYPQQGLIKTFQDFMNELSGLNYEPEFKKWWAEVVKSNLTEKEKELLRINMSKSNL